MVVPDASVAAKWFLPRANEPLTEEAVGLLKEYEHGRIAFVVPGIFWPEIGNIFWKAARLGRWTPEAASAATQAMVHRAFPTVADSELLEDAISIALAFRRTVYDSLYVALAMRLKAEVLTADERLADALAARLPVKWLGARAL